MLSGGGAGGVSHVGVLKALEEREVPIDFVAGTSIGALIGGLYAAGYSPEEIERFFVSKRFIDWANGQVDLKYQNYYKEKEPESSWITFKFSIDTIFETNLPTSYINPFPVDLALLELFGRTNAIAMESFDSLFIPFRCVGANISNREMVIFDKGDLVRSVRASMSYPFFLSPAEIDGELYFDGGLYNNFPTDLVCEQFNPDFIIGSNASSNFPKPRADNVLSQIKYMLSQNTSYEINCDEGLIIDPKIDVNVFDFSRNQFVIDSAYNKTLQLIDSIRGYVTDRNIKDSLEVRRKAFRRGLPPLIFDELNVAGVNNAQMKYIDKTLKVKKDTIGFQRLEPKLYSLTMDEKIKSIYPSVSHKEESDLFKLNLDIEEEKKIFLSFGGNLSNKPINQGYIGLQYNYLGRAAIRLNGNGYFGQFYGSAKGGARIDLLFPTPFYAKVNFISNRWNYYESDEIIGEINDPIYLLSRENFAQAGIGIPVGQKGKLEAMGNGGRNKFEYYQDNSFTQFDTTDVTIFDNTNVSLTYDRNSMNRKQYPSAGSQLLIKAKYTHGNEETQPGSTADDKTRIDRNRFWYSVKFKYDKYYSRNHKMKFGTLIEAVYSDQPTFSNYISSLLTAPAFEPIPELTTLFEEPYRSFTYMAGGVKMIYSFSPRFNFRLEGFVYQPYEEILQDDMKKAVRGLEFAKRYYIGSATSVIHTPVGPLAISLNYYNERIDRLSLIAHFGYLIFNDKMLH